MRLARVAVPVALVLEPIWSPLNSCAKERRCSGRSKSSKRCSLEINSFPGSGMDLLTCFRVQSRDSVVHFWLRTPSRNKSPTFVFQHWYDNVSQRTASRVTTCRYESRSIHCLGQRRRRLRSYVAKAKTLVPSPNGTRPPANPPSYSSATTTRSDTTILHGFHGVFLLFNLWFALASAETCSTLLRVCCFQHLQHVSLHFEI